ncbi:MAG TPA: ROK family protein [Acidimicrobiia bacterium]
MPPTIGIDVGGTKVLGVALDARGAVIDEHRVLNGRGADGVQGAIDAVYGELAARVPTADAVGVGIAGLVDFAGHMRYGPNLPEVLVLPVREHMEQLSARPVSVDNDANTAGYGELLYGAARGTSDALLVTLGTGIGGAIIANGAIYRGANGFAAEIGHFTLDRSGPICACGERGHWEAMASGTALGRMGADFVASGRGAAIAKVAAGAPVTGVHVGAAAAAGDAGALAVLDEFADNVALGLAALSNILDPELIMIGGGLVGLGALLFTPLEAAFRAHLEGTQYRNVIRVVPAALGERAGAIGAAAQAAELVA